MSHGGAGPMPRVLAASCVSLIASEHLGVFVSGFALHLHSELRGPLPWLGAIIYSRSVMTWTEHKSQAISVRQCVAHLQRTPNGQYGYYDDG